VGWKVEEDADYLILSRPGIIYLCGAFWNAPMVGTDSKAGTLIHESSHWTVHGGTIDYAYGQSNCKALAFNNPDQATVNADSHEYLLRTTLSSIKGRALHQGSGGSDRWRCDIKSEVCYVLEEKIHQHLFACVRTTATFSSPDPSQDHRPPKTAWRPADAARIAELRRQYLRANHNELLHLALLILSFLSGAV